MRYGSWFRVACALPGKWSDLLTGPRPLLPQSPLSPNEAEDLAKKSPRANGYLALEPEVHTFGDQNGWLGYGALNHVLLGVGGVHGQTHTDTLKKWRQSAAEHGYQPNPQNAAVDQDSPTHWFSVNLARTAPRWRG